MNIKFCFQGHMTTELKHVWHIATANRIDITEANFEEILKGLKSKEYTLDLADAIDNLTEGMDVEFHDFDKAD